MTFRFRTVTVKPLGAPSRVGSSDKEYWVFGHAHRQIAEAQINELLGLLLGGGGQDGHAVAAVDLG